MLCPLQCGYLWASVPCRGRAAMSRCGSRNRNEFGVSGVRQLSDTWWIHYFCLFPHCVTHTVPSCIVWLCVPHDSLSYPSSPSLALVEQIKSAQAAAASYRPQPPHTGLPLVSGCTAPAWPTMATSKVDLGEGCQRN